MINNNERPKILVVDDDEIHLSIIEDLLMPEYEIITAGSGKEALEDLYKGFSPNLVLLDLLMENMDGWETYNRIRVIALLKKIPIAFLTAVNENKEIQHAKEIGAADYITKPYDSEDLLNRIKKMLGDSLINGDT
jgi:putative two-component system response regulator